MIKFDPDQRPSLAEIKNTIKNVQMNSFYDGDLIDDITLLTSTTAIQALNFTPTTIPEAHIVINSDLKGDISKIILTCLVEL